MADESVGQEQEIEYDGFATPCLILVKANNETARGKIIDPYVKTKDQDGLICGSWGIGFEDGLVHLYLMKPVAAICDEREGWVAKKILLKEPVSYVSGSVQHPVFQKAVKQQPVADTETGVIKW